MEEVSDAGGEVHASGEEIAGLHQASQVIKRLRQEADSDAEEKTEP